MAIFKGYVYIWDKIKGKHVYEHRKIMEEHLGRELLPEEDVHHIDGNRQNNTLGNLIIVDHNVHARISRTKNRSCGLPGCEASHHAKGFCRKHYRLAFPDRWYTNQSHR